ncbi:MAG: PIN domain-containing protein [Alphaproteobacteria bacterium]
MSVFLDTNILIYSISDAPTEIDKRSRAVELLRRWDVVLSVQVLQEFYVQATRPARISPLSHEDAVDLIQVWLRFDIRTVDIEMLSRALTIKSRLGFSYWDSAIVAAAQIASCTELYTEDLSTGQVIDDLTIVNPFH